MVQEKKIKFLINIAYYAVILTIVFLVFKYFLGLIMPFFLALLISAVMRPLVRLLTKKFRFKPALAGIVSTVIFYGTIGALFVLLGIKLIDLLSNVFSTLPDFYVQALEPFLRNSFDRLSELGARFGFTFVGTFDESFPLFIASLGESVTKISGAVLGQLTGIATKLPLFIAKSLIMVIASFFIAADYDRLTAFITNVLPENALVMVNKIKNSFSQMGLHYGKSYAKILCLTFIEISIGLLILRVPNAITIALATACLDILPILGTGMVLGPWAVISLIQGNYFLGIGLLVLYGIITVIRQFIEPKIVGKQMGLHPLVTLMSMFVGLSLFGGVGLFGLPITIAIVHSLYLDGAISIIGLKRKKPKEEAGEVPTE